MKIDQLIRTSRRTIALIVRRDGQLIVRAPQRATNVEILRFIEEKADWIRAKQAEALKRQPPARQYVDGETFLYLGQAYPLELVNDTRPVLTLSGERFRLAKTALPRAKEAFTAWYRLQAHQVLEERSHQLAARFKLRFERVHISSARTRWGSCSSNGTLSFTYRLVMAPLPVIDYVVIHELAHLVEKNHSRRFWERVATMMPDYAQKVKWLKENGHQLNLE